MSLRRAWIPKDKHSTIHLFARESEAFFLCGMTLDQVGEGQFGGASEPVNLYTPSSDMSADRRCARCVNKTWRFL